MNKIPVIRKLDEAVVNRIAAGEVIQRPANALKELIENSLDAKATNIQVTVKNGGLKYIQIQDNGVGIRNEDFPIVCQRFTTSKLTKFEDLRSITTYGFRGEALASISHIAHLTIQSRTASGNYAYRAHFIDGNLIQPVKITAGNQGTQITIEDLFFNMTIRKNALKSSSEEYRNIADVVGKYAIHNASVGFCLKKFGENNDIRTPVCSNQVDNIRTIYGNSIARELIEFSVQDDKYKFKVTGLMTNVNYSTKRLNFLLFINHRLVENQSLKRSIDQIYTNYLPKNMHPFVYLSLQLNPKNVDVNVHPTKHEVHFLNEEQIVDIITSTVEKKLLCSNNSRVYFTQSKLPIITSETIQNSKKPAEKVYAKDLIRTSSSSQKLEKFFGASLQETNMETDENLFDSKMIVDDDDDNEDLEIKKPISKNKRKATKKVEFLEKKNQMFFEENENFENKLLENTFADSSISKSKTILGYKIVAGEIIKNCVKTDAPWNECRLTSVIRFRKKIDDDCHPALRELFSQHVFVGCISPSKSMIQYKTKLYLCNTKMIMEELFYQVIMYNFQNFGSITFADPLSIRELATIALNVPQTGWEPEDGDKNELAKKITEVLTEKGEMLNEYFQMNIDEYGNLKSLPMLLDKHVPELAGLPLYLLRLSTEVNWELEADCFESFARETAKYYSVVSDRDHKNWKWFVEHVFYPNIKSFFLPPKKFLKNGSLIQVADLPHLYKVFERC